MTMLDDFIIRAAIAGIGVALVAGPLGCFVVWRRMSYFGDTLAHAGLTGVALGLVLGISPAAGIIFVGVVVGLLLFALQRQRRIPTDTLLGILSHSALAVGLIAVSFFDALRVDLMSYLLGDILAVSMHDIVWIHVGALALLGVLSLIWKPLIAVTVDEDMAIAEGINALRVQLIFTLLIALTVALAMKVVGVLLVTALLIIPAATARRFARTPEGMAVGAAGLGAVAVILGLLASLQWDTPSGPSIVAAAATVFALSLVLGATLKHSGR